MSKKQPKPKNLVKYLSMSALTILVLSLVGIVIAAGENKGVTPKQEDKVQESPAVKSGNYNLVSFTKEGEAVNIPNGAVVTLNIDGEHFGGKAACNSYSGSFQKGDTGMIVVSPIDSTRMGCEHDLMDLEQTYLQTLQTVNDVKSVGDKVTLYSGSMANTSLVFELSN